MFITNSQRFNLTFAASPVKESFVQCSRNLLQLLLPFVIFRFAEDTVSKDEKLRGRVRVLLKNNKSSIR
jgi:hypothetical protein